MKLYFTPGACSLASHIVLREAGFKFDLEKVDLAGKKTAGGDDFTAINVKGYVPALRLDDGQVLTEGVAIMQYLADRKPESGLAPRAGTMERYRLIEWLNFISTEIHKSFGPLWNPKTPEETRQNQKNLLAKRVLALKSGERAIRLRLPFVMEDSHVNVLVDRIAACLPSPAKA